MIGRVRYVGERVAVIIAASEAQARDAAELVAVDYEPLPVVVDAADAVAPGAPLVHEAPLRPAGFHSTRSAPLAQTDAAGQLARGTALSD